MGSSKKDFLQFPQEVMSEIGHALYVAQKGGKHKDAKPLKGFGGGSVIEIKLSDRHGTYRTIYTIQLKEAILVLHAFQKKSKTGIKTPQEDIELIEQRLKNAVHQYQEWLINKDKKNV